MSLTVKGIIVLLLAGLFKGLEIPDADQRAVDLIETLALLVGAAVAFYGRYRHGDIDIFGFKRDDTK